MTRAKTTNCRTCGQPIRVGPDNPRAALTAKADDTALTRTGELLAVIAGRHTYELAAGDLYRRDPYRLTRPAPTVLPEHRCWEPTPSHWHAPTPAAPPAATSERAPF